MSTTARNALNCGLVFLCLTVLVCGEAGALGPSTQPAAKETPIRAVRTLDEIALTDGDLKALGLARAPNAPEPSWGRPFRENWSGWHRGAKLQVIGLRVPGEGNVVHYGLALYPNAWLAQAALDVHRSHCNMWAPITAWPKTGDRCWGGTVVKENVVIYAIRSGREHAPGITAALVKRIDAVLKTPPKVLAARDAEARRCLKIARDARGWRSYTVERAAEVRKFLAGATSVPWCYEAITWLCNYRDNVKQEDTALADRDAQAIFARPDGGQAVEATLLPAAMGMYVQFDATWLAARYARDCPRQWKQFAESLRKGYPDNRRVKYFLAEVGKVAKTLPALIDPKTGLDPRTAGLAEALADWISLLEKDDLTTASRRWAKDDQAAQALAKRWQGLQRVHKQYDYRKWIDGRVGTGAKAIGGAKTFKVGGHSFGHTHIDWAKTAVGWRIARVWLCR